MECLYNHMKDDMIELDSQISQVTRKLMLLYGHKTTRSEMYSEKVQKHDAK